MCNAMLRNNFKGRVDWSAVRMTLLTWFDQLQAEESFSYKEGHFQKYYHLWKAVATSAKIFHEISEAVL